MKKYVHATWTLAAIACGPTDRQPCSEAGCAVEYGGDTTTSGSSEAASTGRPPTSTEEPLSGTGDDVPGSGETTAPSGDSRSTGEPGPGCVPNFGSCVANADCCEAVCTDGICGPPEPDCGSCVSLGRECGEAVDDCGQALDCGQCVGNAACVAGTCECQALECADFSAECGLWDDGCGGIIDCGGCGDGDGCEGGQCVPACTHEEFFLHNNMLDYWTYSVACDLQLKEFALMYVCDENECSPAIGAGGYVSYKLPWGQSQEVNAFCCYAVGTTCFGQEQECLINGQPKPCMCLSAKIQLLADTCPSEHMIVCQ